MCHAVACNNNCWPTYYKLLTSCTGLSSFLTGRYPMRLSATRANLIPFTLLDGINVTYTYLPKHLKHKGCKSLPAVSPSLLPHSPAVSRLADVARRRGCPLAR